MANWVLHTDSGPFRCLVGQTHRQQFVFPNWCCKFQIDLSWSIISVHGNFHFENILKVLICCTSCKANYFLQYKQNRSFSTTPNIWSVIMITSHGFRHRKPKRSSFKNFKRRSSIETFLRGESASIHARRTSSLLSHAKTHRNGKISLGQQSTHATRPSPGGIPKSQLAELKKKTSQLADRISNHKLHVWCPKNVKWKWMMIQFAPSTAQ